MTMPHTPLSALGENAVLRRLLPLLPSNDRLLHGAGDDCAVVQRDARWDSLLKTDVVVEGVHFLPGTEPERIGRKALARAVSDIAAMGGLPEHALITLLCHPSRSVSLLEGVYRGMAALASGYHISIAGGETSSLPYDGLVINVALTGRVEHGKAVLRSGGSPGDLLYVSGRLGGSFPSGRHLDFEPRVSLARALMEADMRPSAMMDLSDGLATDLPRLAQASQCGFALSTEALPCHAGCTPQQALCDGEDYELLMAFPPALAERLPSLSLPMPLFCIGSLVAEGASELGSGWQHFCF